LDALNDLNSLPTPKKPFKCPVVETVLSSQICDDVNVRSRPCTKTHAPKLHLKSRKPSTRQLSKLKSKFKCASIHASKTNSTSSFEQVSSASEKKASVTIASSVSNPRHGAGKECITGTASDSTSMLMKKLTDIEKYSFSPHIQDSISSLCKTTQILVNEKWKTLTEVEKKNVTSNITYIAMVMSKVRCEGNASLSNAKSDIFMQVQGNSALCGLCALNNAYQANIFDDAMLNELGDGLWIMHNTQMHMPITEQYTPLRDANGWYSIEVLLSAVKHHGDIATCVSHEVSIFFDKQSMSVNIMDIINPCNRYPVSYLIRVPRAAHYIAIVCKGPKEIYLLDSLNSSPIAIDHVQLAEYLLTMYNDPQFGIYSLMRQECEVDKVCAMVWSCI